MEPGKTPEKSLDKFKQGIELFCELYDELVADVDFSVFYIYELHDFLNCENVAIQHCYELKKVYA